jgi:hypothetical protein
MRADHNYVGTSAFDLVPNTDVIGTGGALAGRDPDLSIRSSLRRDPALPAF